MVQKTIRIKGDTNSKINVNGDNKSGFTLILTISAAGKFLTPIMVAKGKTERSLKKFELDDQIIGTFSNNGWTNKGIMKIALKEIYKVTNGVKSVLLLDQFTAHVDDFIKNEAKNYNITLIFIPKGQTSILQPLDVSINGILKEKAKLLWKQERIMNPQDNISGNNGIKHFLAVKNSISADTIKKAFSNSCFNKKYMKK